MGNTGRTVPSKAGPLLQAQRGAPAMQRATRGPHEDPPSLVRMFAWAYHQSLGGLGAPEATDFLHRLKRIREDLREAQSHGAEPAYILHVLAVTAFRSVVSNEDRIVTSTTIPVRNRAQVLGAFRTILQFRKPLGLDPATTIGLWRLARRLTGEVGTVRAPSYLAVGVKLRTAAFRRQEAAMLSACIIALLDALTESPKPIASMALLFQRFGLLEEGTRRIRGTTRLVSAGSVAAIEALRKRDHRYRPQAGDPTTPVGGALLLLKQTFAQTFVQVRRVLTRDDVAQSLNRVQKVGIGNVDSLAHDFAAHPRPIPATIVRRPPSKRRRRQTTR